MIYNIGDLLVCKDSVNTRCLVMTNLSFDIADGDQYRITDKDDYPDDNHCHWYELTSEKDTNIVLIAWNDEGHMIIDMPLMRIPPKECPFCHDMPVLAKYPLWNGSHGYYGNYEYYVACNNGKCKIKPRTKSYNDIYDMLEQECIDKAIDDWNTR